MINNMIDLRDLIDVFIITNGRSTYNICRESVNSQKDVHFRIHVIQDMDWLGAHIELLKKSESKFALRVDDDMLLHPYTVKFMYECIKEQSDKIALRGWRLWEPWSNKICKGIKVYNTVAAKKIGFELDNLGKIDKPFTKNAKKKGYRTEYSYDIVGIHSCGKYEEHLKYWIMRGEVNGPQFDIKKKWAKKLMNKFDMSLEDQYKLTETLLPKLNKKKYTDFGRMI